jgi:hypothetical protein
MSRGSFGAVLYRYFFHTPVLLHSGRLLRMIPDCKSGLRDVSRGAAC